MPGRYGAPYRREVAALNRVVALLRRVRLRRQRAAEEPHPERLTAAWVAWDAWCSTRGGATAVEARRQQRLAALVAHARQASRFYAELYADLPPGTTELRRLPPVTKPQLMARFDDWVTDPAVTRAAVEAFVADLGNIGVDFLGRYVVFTTSGSTGVPTLLVQDHRAVAVMTGLAYARTGGLLTPRLLADTLRHGGRQAAVFATGGHFLTAVMFEAAAAGAAAAAADGPVLLRDGPAAADRGRAATRSGRRCSRRTRACWHCWPKSSVPAGCASPPC